MIKLTAAIKIGENITGSTKTPTLERTRAFSGWPKKNVHTDEEFAKKCGFAGPIASGSMLQGYLADMMLELFGDQWLYYGKMNVSFIKPLFAGQSVSLEATVKSKEKTGDKINFELDVWGNNPQGEKVFIGNCFGFISVK